jgi:hypothetical protein
MFVLWLARHMPSSSLHGDEGVSTLSNEPLKGEVALALPQSRTQQLLMSFDLSFPFVVSSMVRQGKPSVSPILGLWNGSIDVAWEAALVASSSL